MPSGPIVPRFAPQFQTGARGLIGPALVIAAALARGRARRVVLLALLGGAVGCAGAGAAVLGALLVAT